MIELSRSVNRNTSFSLKRKAYYLFVLVEKLLPETNKVYFINEYCLYQILSGNGDIEVDFKLYDNWGDKLIYLSKGQYIKFHSDNFVIRKITFTDEVVFGNKDFRVLFKHLISLGYINFAECKDCQKYLEQTVFAPDVNLLIDVSSEQWYWQNPFSANKDEYHLIFDVKDIIDEEYKNHLSNGDLATILKENGHDAMRLVKNKLGVSTRGLLAQKRLLESQRQLAFTDKSVKEIAFQLGYKDPAYFNRVFHVNTGKRPVDFRSNFDFEGRDSFIQDIRNLLATYHDTNRSLEFYADQMHLSVKSLSRKVRDKMNASLGQLIRMELIKTAQELLGEDLPIAQISRRLSFEEPNHFSAFFKHYTGLTPSEFQNKKYKS